VTVNKINQIIFFLIIFIGSIFNGSNSINLIFLNFFTLFIFFFYLLKNKNNLAKVKFIIKNNKFSFNIFIVFIIYIFLQIIPLPLHWLSFFSETYYNFLSKIGLQKFHAISLNPQSTFFELLNYINIFIIILLTHLIFFKKNHINRYFFYLSIIGFIHAFFGVFIFLLGNPEFLFEKIVYYKSSSTGFFINRTNFAFFLILTFIGSLHFIFNNKFYKNELNNNNNINFNVFYVRFFLLFISIAIITSFSRLGNFYLLLILFFYFIFSVIKTKNFFNKFSIIFYLIILFDLLIIGFYFGGSKLIDRFLFINEDLNIENNLDILKEIKIVGFYFGGSKLMDRFLFINEDLNLENNLDILKEINSTISNSYSRLDIIHISINLFYKFYLFGFGAGAYEQAFLLFNDIKIPFYANHAHSDFMELLAEIGIVGFCIALILFYQILKCYLNSKIKNENNLQLIFLILIIIFIINGFVDFSLNIPSNQYLFASLITLSIKKYL